MSNLVNGLLMYLYIYTLAHTSNMAARRDSTKSFKWPYIFLYNVQELQMWVLYPGLQE